jgi:hypothetical protein
MVSGNMLCVWTALRRPPHTSISSSAGYVDEPWHGRWVGQPLASAMHVAGYHDWTDVDADDVLSAIRIESGLDAIS